MAYEQRPGDISIYRETNKRSENSPDWRGTLITPSGEKLEVSVWEKGGRGTMLAGSVREPYNGMQNKPSATSAKPKQVVDDDEIPF